MSQTPRFLWSSCDGYIDCMLHLWARGEHKPDKALMWIFVTMNRNMPLFNTVHHLLTVLEKYWVLTGDDQLTLSAPHWGPQEAFTVSCSLARILTPAQLWQSLSVSQPYLGSGQTPHYAGETWQKSKSSWHPDSYLCSALSQLQSVVCNQLSSEQN